MPGNILLESRMDRLALRILEFMPKPNVAPEDSVTNPLNFLSLAASPVDQGVTNIRIDHRIAKQDSISSDIPARGIRVRGGVGALGATSKAELAGKIRTEAEYFEKNAERLRYPEFRRQHRLVGSGVIEAGCKTVSVLAANSRGIFWTVRGAKAILTLGCCQFNGRFEDYWEARRA